MMQRFSDELLASLKGKRCLVTGAAGMVGRHVVELLSEIGADVTPTDMRSVVGSTMLVADLRYFDLCERMTEGMDCVFHVAGLKGSAKDTSEHASRYFVPMLQMDTNILEACHLNKVPQVVFTSSIGAYAVGATALMEFDAFNGQPMDIPGWAKRMGDLQISLYCKEYGYNWAVVRLAHIYGPWDKFTEDAMFIPSLLARLKRGDKQIELLGTGTSERDFLYAEDTAEGIIRALIKGTKGDVVNLGSGKGFSIRKVAGIVNSFIPFHYRFNGLGQSYSHRVLDIHRAKKRLGWKPRTSLEDGLRRTWEWLKAQEGGG